MLQMRSCIVPTGVPNATIVVKQNTWSRQGQPPNKWHGEGKETIKKQIGTFTDTTDSNSDGLYAIRDNSSVKPFTVDVKLNRKPLSMELDTGATVSLVSQTFLKQLFLGTTLQHPSTKLHSYSGGAISSMGQLQVNISYENQCVKLPLLVVSGKGPSLFGRDHHNCWFILIL